MEINTTKSIIKNNRLHILIFQNVRKQIHNNFDKFHNQTKRG